MKYFNKTIYVYIETINLNLYLINIIKNVVVHNYINNIESLLFINQFNIKTRMRARINILQLNFPISKYLKIMRWRLYFLFQK